MIHRSPRTLPVTLWATGDTVIHTSIDLHREVIRGHCQFVGTARAPGKGGDP
jgi:hypothetical protein